jgi:hypothetical protein
VKEQDIKNYEEKEARNSEKLEGTSGTKGTERGEDDEEKEIDTWEEKETQLGTEKVKE